MERIEHSQFVNAMDELDFYNLIKIEKSKRDAKMNQFSLKVELHEIIEGLEKLRQKSSANMIQPSSSKIIANSTVTETTDSASEANKISIKGGNTSDEHQWTIN